MSGLDLKKFKKVSEDQHTATLKHPHGHEIKIAKGGISPSLRDQLASLPGIKMSHGGEVKEHSPEKFAEKFAKKHPEKFPKPIPKEQESKEPNGPIGPQASEAFLSRAQGGEVKGVHEPYGERNITHTMSEKEKEGASLAGEAVRAGARGDESGARVGKAEHKRVLEEMKSMKKPVLAAEGVDTMSRDDSDTSSDGADRQPASDQPTPPQQPQSPVNIHINAAPAPQGQPQVQAQPPQNVAQQALSAPQQPFNQQVAQNPSIQAGNAAIAANPNHFAKDDMLWAHDLANGHITPKTYGDLFAEKSTLGKIGAVFGLLVSGAGSGLAHQQNAALGYMDKLIQNDLEAQKQSKANAQNYWRLSQNQLLNDANVKLTNAQAAAITQPLAWARSNRAAFQSLVDKMNSLPPGSPQRQQYAQALAALKGAMEDKNMKLTNQAQVMYESLGGNGNVPTVTPQAPAPGTTPTAKPLGMNKPSQGGASGDWTNTATADESVGGYGDEHLKPGSDTAPYSDPPPLMNIDYDKIKRSQFLGEKGVYGQLSPGEIGPVNQAVDQINATNQALKEIHSQFEQMWKSGSGIDTLSPALKDQHLFGVRLPDFAKLGTNADSAKRYYTAASAVKKQLANVIKGGGSSELYDLIEDQLPRFDDTPEDYRQKLRNVDRILQQQIPVSVLSKYGLATGLPR